VAANCRDCPKQTRELCIQQSSTSPSVKRMMRGAFELGRDSEWMWGLLQMNCLLRPQGREGESSRPPPATQPVREEARQAQAIDDIATRFAPPPKPAAVEGVPSGFYLVLQGGRYRVALPKDGEIVLGRFDPMVHATPDVDLSYVSGGGRAISRRHARIVGRNGRHEIEDVGSVSGTLVNWRRLRIGHKAQLQPGDRVVLGHCEFVYGTIPELKALPQTVPNAYLMVTSTGQRFPLPLWGELVIGRSDRTVGLNPDIDLSGQGNVAQFVARRHAKIFVRNDRHCVEDLGSASGTRLNGASMRIGRLEPLYPGYHLWLGGCVLVYDIEL